MLCQNRINVFDFHVGHDIPESLGGMSSIENLKPICSRCNHSMSNNYTIKEWNKLYRSNKCWSFLKIFYKKL
jgi:5-methylcytosine-specific restriction endonuclease McrA